MLKIFISLFKINNKVESIKILLLISILGCVVVSPIMALGGGDSDWEHESDDENKGKDEDDPKAIGVEFFAKLKDAQGLSNEEMSKEEQKKNEEKKKTEQENAYQQRRKEVSVDSGNIAAARKVLGNLLLNRNTAPPSSQAKIEPIKVPPSAPTTVAFPLPPPPPPPPLPGTITDGTIITAPPLGTRDTRVVMSVNSSTLPTTKTKSSSVAPANTITNMTALMAQRRAALNGNKTPEEKAMRKAEKAEKARRREEKARAAAAMPLSPGKTSPSLSTGDTSLAATVVTLTPPTRATTKTIVPVGTGDTTIVSRTKRSTSPTGTTKTPFSSGDNKGSVASIAAKLLALSKATTPPGSGTPPGKGTPPSLGTPLGTGTPSGTIPLSVKSTLVDRMHTFIGPKSDTKDITLQKTTSTSVFQIPNELESPLVRFAYSIAQKNNKNVDIIKKEAENYL